MLLLIMDPFSSTILSKSSYFIYSCLKILSLFANSHCFLDRWTFTLVTLYFGVSDFSLHSVFNNF